MPSKFRTVIRYKLVGGILIVSTIFVNVKDKIGVKLQSNVFFNIKVFRFFTKTCANRHAFSPTTVKITFRGHPIATLALHRKSTKDIFLDCTRMYKKYKFHEEHENKQCKAGELTHVLKARKNIAFPHNDIFSPERL